METLPNHINFPFSWTLVVFIIFPVHLRIQLQAVSYCSLYVVCPYLDYTNGHTNTRTVKKTMLCSNSYQIYNNMTY